MNNASHLSLLALLIFGLLLPSLMLGRKTDNKRVMTPAEREGKRRAIRRPRAHISTGCPPLISIEVMKKIASMILAFVSKGTSTGSLLTAGRSRFQYYCREFQGRAGEETATKSSARRALVEH